MLVTTALVGAAIGTIGSGEARAQFYSPGASAGAPVAAPPRVFLDCQGTQCDRNHFRTEITFVNWAQDRADADVHVIATSEPVGGGGRRYVFDFIGLGAMESLTDRLTYTASGTDVQAETRDGMTQTLRLGLLRYAIQTGLGNSFTLSYSGPVAVALADSADAEAPAAAPAPAQQRDPWNYWTFQVGISGNFNIRETSQNTRFDPSFSADRVTEDWKLSFGAELGLQRNKRQLSNGREIRDDRDDWSIDGLIVRSVSDHLSLGFQFEAGNSVNQNRHARIQGGPAIEYNYYPYMQASRRQLTVLYALEMQHSNYMDTTIFNVTEQTVPVHGVTVRYQSREQWGNAGGSVTYSQYLHQGGLYSVGLNGNLSFRITRGLDLSLSGNASWVQNDIHTPLADIPDEDILLGRRNLPSNYVYGGRIGLTYRFGSAFTNIVNTRFGGGGGGGGGFGGGF